MAKRRKISTLLYFSACLSSMILLSSCSLVKTPLQSSGSGFVQDGFLKYQRIAILPFEGDETGEVTDAFSLSFRNKFNHMDIVGRKELRGIFRRQDLQLGQLSKDARTRIGREYDVDAFVIGSIYYPSISRWLLQIQIVDTMTGEILGRSLAEVDYMGDLGFKEGCELAVQNLRPAGRQE